MMARLERHRPMVCKLIPLVCTIVMALSSAFGVSRAHALVPAAQIGKTRAPRTTKRKPVASGMSTRRASLRSLRLSWRLGESSALMHRLMDGTTTAPAPLLRRGHLDLSTVLGLAAVRNVEVATGRRATLRPVGETFVQKHKLRLTADTEDLGLKAVFDVIDGELYSSLMFAPTFDLGPIDVGLAASYGVCMSSGGASTNDFGVGLSVGHWVNDLVRVSLTVESAYRKEDASTIARYRKEALRDRAVAFLTTSLAYD